MSEISKQALKVENSQSFPNNTAGLITPSDLRAFNEDMIDSLVDEIKYNADSASWNQSIDALEQFTSSQQPSFTALNAFTASQLVVNGEVNTFTQSADGRLDALESEVDSLQTWTGSVNEISDDGSVQGYATRFNFTGNVSASIVQNVGGAIASIDIPFGSVDTGSLLLTASFDDTTRNLTFTKADSSQFSVYIADVSGSVLPEGVVSGSSQIILQDTTGDLSGSRINGAVDTATNSTYSQNTITTGKNLSGAEILKGTPLFFTASGTSGNIVGIYPADAGNPSRMPAGGIAGETIADEAEGVVLLDGFINGVNTVGFPSGAKVYVAVGGGYTITPPTGSANKIQYLGNIEKSATNGSGVIQMMGESRGLPNIQKGYAWVGDANDVPQAVATSSFAGDSFPYIGDAQITGSLSVSKTIESQIYINPQTLSGSLTIPTDKNAMVVGTVTVDGEVVIEGNSKLVVIDQIEPYVLPEGILSSSATNFTDYSASVDTRINNIIVGEGYATTGSNSFVGNQTITGSLELIDTTAFLKVSDAYGPNKEVQLGRSVEINGGSSGGVLKVTSNSGASFNATDGSLYMLRSGSAQIFTQMIVEGIKTTDWDQADGNANVFISAAPYNLIGLGYLDNNLPYRGMFFSAASSFAFDEPTQLIIGQGRPNTSAENKIQIGDVGITEVLISGSVAITEVMNLTAQDPLPSGNVGDLAVSGSSLYFYNGAWTLIV